MESDHLRPRVFCIGMNKTGTSSLNAAFELLGLRSLHRSRLAEPAIARAIAEGQPLLSYIDEFDCYTDAPFYRHYQALDQQYFPILLNPFVFFVLFVVQLPSLGSKMCSRSDLLYSSG